MYASFFAYYETDFCVLWSYHCLQNVICVQSFGLYDTRYIKALFSCSAIVIEPYRPAPLKRREGAHRVISNKADIAFDIHEDQLDVL